MKEEKKSHKYIYIFMKQKTNVSEIYLYFCETKNNNKCLRKIFIFV